MAAVLVPHEYVGGTALSADAPSTRTVVPLVSRLVSRGGDTKDDVRNMSNQSVFQTIQVFKL